MSLDRHDGILALDGLKLSEVAETFGTPCYVYSAASIIRNYQAFEHAFAEINPLICYAVKANSNLSILALLASMGAGFDIVSSGELERVRLAGGSPRRSVFSGVGKTAREIQDALREDIHCFNVESEAELSALARIAEDAQLIAPVSLRVNPDVDPKTHPYIATGLKEAKFGVSMQQAERIYQEAAKHPHLKMVGIDCHIGSQITEIEPYLEAATRLFEMVDQLAKTGLQLQHVDLGGGMGIRYQNEPAFPLAELARWLKPRLDERQLELVLEPGRSIVADSGLLITEVLYIKSSEDKHFYNAWQKIESIEPAGNDTDALHYDVVGPICETGDFLAKDRLLNTAAGQHLAVLDAGAYGFVMSSNYNSRPRAAEILIEAGKARVIRPRESLSALVKDELGCLTSS
jgi:diaminopimelate decarboxylase